MYPAGFTRQGIAMHADSAPLVSNELPKQSHQRTRAASGLKLQGPLAAKIWTFWAPTCKTCAESWTNVDLHCPSLRQSSLTVSVWSKLWSVDWNAASRQVGGHAARTHAQRAQLRLPWGWSSVCTSELFRWSQRCATFAAVTTLPSSLLPWSIGVLEIVERKACPSDGELSSLCLVCELIRSKSWNDVLGTNSCAEVGGAAPPRGEHQQDEGVTSCPRVSRVCLMVRPLVQASKPLLWFSLQVAELLRDEPEGWPADLWNLECGQPVQGEERLLYIIAPVDLAQFLALCSGVFLPLSARLCPYILHTSLVSSPLSTPCPLFTHSRIHARPCWPRQGKTNVLSNAF